jgi:hypothetical protein
MCGVKNGKNSPENSSDYSVSLKLHRVSEMNTFKATSNFPGTHDDIKNLRFPRALTMN